MIAKIFCAILASLAGATALAADQPAAAAELIAIKDGKILTVTKGVIEKGTVLIRGDKIEAVGVNLTIPPGARVIDARGMTVYPGWFDSNTGLGLVEVDLEPATVDRIEPSEEITPQMRVVDALHVESELIPVTRLNGVTSAIVSPAETNTMSGLSALILLDGKTVDEMVIVPDIALNINFGPQARRRDKFPGTRMGMIAQMRQAFSDAQDYAQRKARAEAGLPAGAVEEREREERGPRPFKHDLKLEALLPVLAGKRPVILGAAEPSEIKTIMTLAQEFKLRVILSHITHAQDILDEVAAWKVPVLVGPIYDMPKEEQRYDGVFRLPAELSRRGVKFAFQSADAHNVRNLPYQAGYAVAYGLPYDEAIKALTIYPAEIWGVADRLGSLEPGKLANVVLATGDPLEPRTDVKYVFIKGREIPMESRQKRLYEQYRSQ